MTTRRHGLPGQVGSNQDQLYGMHKLFHTPAATRRTTAVRCIRCVLRWELCHDDLVRLPPPVGSRTFAFHVHLYLHRPRRCQGRDVGSQTSAGRLEMGASTRVWLRPMGRGQVPAADEGVGVGAADRQFGGHVVEGEEPARRRGWNRRAGGTGAVTGRVVSRRAPSPRPCGPRRGSGASRV